MVVLITGTGRCGTHTIFHMFDRIEGCIALHEGRGKVNGKTVDLGDFKAVNISSRLDLQDERIERVKEESFKRRKDLIDSTNKHIIDVNRMGYRMIEYYDENIDDVKFVHLVRNGYDCVRSWYSRKSIYPDLSILTSIMKHYFAKLRSEPEYIKKTIESVYAYYRKDKITNNKIETMNEKNQFNYAVEKPIPDNKSFWNRYRRIEKISWYWMYVNKFIKKELKKLDQEKSKVVRIEDINKGKMEEILSFLSIKYEHGYDKIGKHDTSKKKYEWNSKDISLFNKICGDIMEEMGYGLTNPC